MIETAFAALVGVFFAAAIYLLLSRSVIRMLLGLTLFGNAVNLLIFTAGRLTREVPPIVPNGMQVPAAPIANPLPQALILTAIVIGFAMFTFLLVLAYRAYQSLGTDDTQEMRLAEPRGGPHPPLDALPDAAAVMDMTYRPLKTAFLQSAEARGLATVDGLNMLIEQARPSFQAFYGVEPWPGFDIRALALTFLGEA